MDIDETETRHSEKISESVRADILSSGDDILVNLISRLPDEATARLAKIIGKYN